MLGRKACVTAKAKKISRDAGMACSRHGDVDQWSPDLPRQLGRVTRAVHVDPQLNQLSVPPFSQKSNSTATSRRVDKLQLKLKALKDSANFYQEKGYTEQFQVAMKKCEKAQSKLMQELADSDSESD